MGQVGTNYIIEWEDTGKSERRAGAGLKPRGAGPSVTVKLVVHLNMVYVTSFKLMCKTIISKGRNLKNLAQWNEYLKRLKSAVLCITISIRWASISIVVAIPLLTTVTVIVCRCLLLIGRGCVYARSISLNATKAFPNFFRA